MRKNGNVWMALCTMACLSLMSVEASAEGAAAQQPGAIGVGIGQGTNVDIGISAKFIDSSELSYQLGLGVWRRWRRYRRDRYYYNDNGLGISFDLLYELGTLVPTKVVDIGANLGVGPGLGINDDWFQLSLGGVAGLEFNIVPLPLDLVIEWRPQFHLFEFTDFDLIHFTGHFRIYF